MSTTDKPVTQTADVAVNRDVIKLLGAVSLVEKGKYSKKVPISIMNKNIIAII